LERYQLGEEIARGTYGIVHRATDLETGRIVALKRLRIDRRPGSALERFFREARLAAGLDHPNIVRVYDVGWEEEYAFFTMELLEGPTLEERLRQGAIPLPEALTIGTALAGALDHLHRRGVLHRDLKPANIVLTPRGPVITDFGVAVSPALSRLTETGELVGTPAYMAPEVLREGARGADARSDLYSLGTVLYEMVAGRAPFEASSFLELSHQVLEVEPIAPPALANPILRCLRKRPSERFASGAELAAALLPSPRSRPRLRPFLAVLGILVLLSGIVAAGRARRRASPSLPRPRLRIDSSPQGARVALVEADASRILGHTPTEIELPFPGEYELTLSKVGHLNRRRTIRIEGRDMFLRFRMYTPGEIPEGTLLVERREPPLLVERQAVSCRDYARFLRVTFRTPPHGWRRDAPPRGSEENPVTGITHEDAVAYARWRGRRLPTLEERRRAEVPAGPIREWTASPGRTGFIIVGLEGASESSPETRSPILGFRCVLDLAE